MQKKEYHFSYEVYESAAELPTEDALLLDKARETTVHAYAPYSRFRVGAAARLNNGQIVTGTNQENASFPVGICAERVLLSAAASLYPGMPVRAIAISYFNEQGPAGQPISPCGVCRQSLQEFETRTGQPIRLILGGQTGPIYVIPRSSSLLPIAFVADDLV
ncbi:MAG TPA: cytidine deaminase [Puia sp.]|jgi:cytidine deaminase|nr:cytidine deaminase [Puia sp.]